MIWDDVLQAIPRDQWGTFQAGAMYGAAMTAAGAADMALGTARCENDGDFLKVPIPGGMADVPRPPPMETKIQDALIDDLMKDRNAAFEAIFALMKAVGIHGSDDKPESLAALDMESTKIWQEHERIINRALEHCGYED
jgi:hypothetical protein